MSDGGAPVVLAVDDNHDLLDTYEIWLGDDYDLRTAASGEAALAMLDEEVTVVLLDRLMPELSGDDVLARIRERDLTCQVAMATAVEPDEDIAEMPIDAYVPKALDRDTVTETVDRLVRRAAYDETLREHYAVAEKLATLEERKTGAELADSEAYHDLEARFETLERRLAERSDAAGLSVEDLVVTASADDPPDPRDSGADGRGDSA